MMKPDHLPTHSQAPLHQQKSPVKKVSRRDPRLQRKTLVSASQDKPIPTILQANPPILVATANYDQPLPKTEAPPAIPTKKPPRDEPRPPPPQTTLMSTSLTSQQANPPALVAIANYDQPLSKTESKPAKPTKKLPRPDPRSSQHRTTLSSTSTTSQAKSIPTFPQSNPSILEATTNCNRPLHKTESQPTKPITANTNPNPQTTTPSTPVTESVSTTRENNGKTDEVPKVNEIRPDLLTEDRPSSPHSASSTNSGPLSPARGPSRRPQSPLSPCASPDPDDLRFDIKIKINSPCSCYSMYT